MRFVVMGCAPYEGCWNIDYDREATLRAFATREAALAWASEHGYCAHDVKVFELEEQS